MPIEHLHLLSMQLMPHGTCYLWQPGLIWLHALSDGAIALAYFSIPIELAYFARKRPDLPFPWIFWMFVIFIFGCGATHVLEVLTIWKPTYWLSGGIKAATALVSVATAVALVGLIPKALALKGEDKFRAVVESSPDAMVIVDKNGRIVLVNGQAEKLFGYPRAEMLGETLEMLIPPRFRDSHRDDRSTYFIAPRVRVMDSGANLYGLRKDGTEFPADISLSPLETEDGTWVSSAIRDITTRKRAEEAVRELNESQQRQAAQLEAANKELEAFSYSVSHDLRAPLRSIDGFSLALVEDYAGKLDEHARNYLERIRAATQRMAQLIDDLLNLSRISRSDMSRQAVDLSAIANSILAEFRQHEPARLVECIVPDAVVVNGDPRLLQVVLENLLGNAWKFTGKMAHAIIELGVEQHDGDDTTYFVRDDGAGFDMAFAGKLFGPFQRLHTTREFPGTGIGLTTVQRIIHRHGGRVWAEGAEGKGATFSFTL
jgi:PAS domain S-box-containing protein